MSRSLSPFVPQRARYARHVVWRSFSTRWSVKGVYVFRMRFSNFLARFNYLIINYIIKFGYSIYPIYSLAESLWRKEGSFEKISIYKSRIVNNEIRIFGRKIIISFNRREKENNFNFIERMYISSLIYIYDVVEPERERERKRVFSTIAYRNEIQILATFRNAASCFLGTVSSY